MDYTTLPQEILLIIITLCDGFSLENLKYTSKKMRSLVKNRIKEFSRKELLEMIIPVFKVDDLGFATYYMHYHQLLNGKLHGKLEIYLGVHHSFRAGLNVRAWFENDKLTACTTFQGGRCRRWDLFALTREEFDRCVEEYIRELQNKAIFRAAGKNRKRGKYSNKRKTNPARQQRKYLKRKLRKN
jgi:hypothetical protein